MNALRKKLRIWFVALLVALTLVTTLAGCDGGPKLFALEDMGNGCYYEEATGRVFDSNANVCNAFSDATCCQQ